MSVGFGGAIAINSAKAQLKSVVLLPMNLLKRYKPLDPEADLRELERDKLQRATWTTKTKTSN